MSAVTLYGAAGAVLFTMGLVALVLRTARLQQVLAINVMSVGVSMGLIASAFTPQGTDSVPHALVLTGIVVIVSATAFALALLVRMERSNHSATDSPRRPTPWA